MVIAINCDRATATWLSQTNKTIATLYTISASMVTAAMHEVESNLQLLWQFQHDMTAKVSTEELSRKLSRLFLILIFWHFTAWRSQGKILDVTNCRCMSTIYIKLPGKKWMAWQSGILAYRDLYSCWNISAFQFESMHSRLASELRKPQMLPKCHQQLGKVSLE